MSNKQARARTAARWTPAALLAAALALSACGGGGGGSGGGGNTGGGGAGPSEPGGTVPDSAMSSMSEFMRFMRNWASDDTVEPFALSAKSPPGEDGDARPID